MPHGGFSTARGLLIVRGHLSLCLRVSQGWRSGSTQIYTNEIAGTSPSWSLYCNWIRPRIWCEPQENLSPSWAWSIYPHPIFHIPPTPMLFNPIPLPHSAICTVGLHCRGGKQHVGGRFWPSHYCTNSLNCHKALYNTFVSACAGGTCIPPRIQVWNWVDLVNSISPLCHISKVKGLSKAQVILSATQGKVQNLPGHAWSSSLDLSHSDLLTESLSMKESLRKDSKVIYTLVCARSNVISWKGLLLTIKIASRAVKLLFSHPADSYPTCNK